MRTPNNPNSSNEVTYKQAHITNSLRITNNILKTILNKILLCVAAIYALDKDRKIY